MLHAITKSIVGLESKRLAGFYLPIISLAVLLAGATQAEQLPIKTYTIADGLAHSSVGSIYQDHKGFLWIASEGDISRFDPRKEKEATPPAAVYFTRLQVAGEEVRLAEIGAEIVPPLELAATQNNLTIAFVAPNYQDVNKPLTWIRRILADHPRESVASASSAV